MDRGTQWGCGLWGCKESDMTKQLTHIHTYVITKRYIHNIFNIFRFSVIILANIIYLHKNMFLNISNNLVYILFTFS